MQKKFLITTAFTLIVWPFQNMFGNAQAFELFPRPESQYTVQRGDTLYGIAGQYYSDSAMWPFLWNQNPQVKIGPDARKKPEEAQLKPGTKINLYHSNNAPVVVNHTYEPPTGVPDEMRFFVSKIPLQGLPYDKKFFRYKLSPRPTRLLGYIVASPDTSKVNLIERDLVYIRIRPSKKQSILVGDRLGVYRERGPMDHPLNPEREIGYFSEIVGEVEIISTGNELLTGIILESFVEIQKGDKICLFTPRDREIVPTKTHRLLTGTVLSSATRDAASNEDQNYENDIIIVNRGECHGMKEGMLLNIYRPPQPTYDPYFSRDISLPDKFLGEGMVLKAFDKTSTVLITTSREEVTSGDIIKTVSD